MQSGTQDDGELFPRIIKDIIVKIVRRLIKRFFPSESDYQNSILEHQHGTEYPQILSKIGTSLTKMRYSY